MVQLNFNATQVKPNAALEAIPSGNYPVIITNSAEKPTQAGDGAYIELEMTIQGGEFGGRKVFDRLNIKNKNETAVQIAYATLSAICHVTGRLNITETQQLHGVPFIAVVLKKKRNDQPDVDTNEVKGYKDMNGNDPGKAPGNGGPSNSGPANGAGGPGWGNPNGGPANMQQPQGGYQQQPQNGNGQPQGGGGWGPQNGGGQPQGGNQQPNNGWQGQPQGGNQQPQGGGQQLDPNAPPPWA